MIQVQSGGAYLSSGFFATEPFPLKVTPFERIFHVLTSLLEDVVK
jgi:hypothetical protein